MNKLNTYLTPNVTVYEIYSEGALCESGVNGSFNPNNLTNGQSGWFEDLE